MDTIKLFKIERVENGKRLIHLGASQANDLNTRMEWAKKGRLSISKDEREFVKAGECAYELIEIFKCTQTDIKGSKRLYNLAHIYRAKDKMVEIVNISAIHGRSMGVY